MNPLLLLLSEYGDVEVAYSVNTMEFWRDTLLKKSCIGFIHSSLVEQEDNILDDLLLIKIKEKLRSNLGCLCPYKTNEVEDTFISYVKHYLNRYSRNNLDTSV